MRNDDLNGQAVYILSAARTPIGKLMGRLSTMSIWSIWVPWRWTIRRSRATRLVSG